MGGYCFDPFQTFAKGTASFGRDPQSLYQLAITYLQIHKYGLPQDLRIYAQELLPRIV